MGGDQCLNQLQITVNGTPSLLRRSQRENKLRERQMEASCFKAIIEFTSKDGIRHLTPVIQIWWSNSRSLWSNHENHARLAYISYHECNLVLVRSLKWVPQKCFGHVYRVANRYRHYILEVCWRQIVVTRIEHRYATKEVLSSE